MKLTPINYDFEFEIDYYEFEYDFEFPDYRNIIRQPGRFPASTVSDRPVEGCNLRRDFYENKQRFRFYKLDNFSPILYNPEHLRDCTKLSGVFKP